VQDIRSYPLCDTSLVNRTARQNIAVLHQPTQKLATILLFVDGVNDDAGVEKETSHLAGGYFLKAALSFLASFS
jgi:hypothetical protein